MNCPVRDAPGLETGIIYLNLEMEGIIVTSGLPSPGESQTDTMHFLIFSILIFTTVNSINFINRPLRPPRNPPLQPPAGHPWIQSDHRAYFILSQTRGA